MTAKQPVRITILLVLFGVISIAFATPQTASAATCGGLPDSGVVPDGTYTFPAGCVHTITNTLSVTGNVTIVGSGGTITGSSTHNIVAVDPGASLVIRDLILRDGAGYRGSAIYNSQGTVTISGSVITGNLGEEGGGIYNYRGNLTLINSTVSDNEAWLLGSVYIVGGGLMNEEGQVTIRDSAFDGNRTGMVGGAIFNNRGVIEIENSSFTNNSAPNMLGVGAAIANFGGTVTMRNTVVTGNAATNFGGGLYNYLGTYNLCGMTYANNVPDDTAGPGTFNITDACDSPPPPMCNTLDEGVQAFDLPDGIYCRTLFDAGGWKANPGSVPFIDGMLLAVEVFRIDGRTVAAGDFGAGIPVCLPGQGRLIFYDASASPRVPVAMETFTAGEMTCAYLINPGTLVLVRE